MSRLPPLSLTNRLIIGGLTPLIAIRYNGFISKDYVQGKSYGKLADIGVRSVHRRRRGRVPTRTDRSVRARTQGNRVAARRRRPRGRLRR